MTDPMRTDHPSPTKRPVPQDKWRQILAAATDLFAAKGYEATTIRDVAEAVGMLGGSLYYYMDTKEDLLYALLEEFHRTGVEDIARAEAQVRAAAGGGAEDPLVMLRAVCISHAESNARSRALSAVFHNDFRHLSDERKRHIAEGRRRHQNRIEELVRACQRAGQLRTDIEPRAAALAMLSMLNATTTWYHPDDRSTPATIAVLLTSLLFEGLAARPAEAPAPPAARVRKPARRKAST